MTGPRQATRIPTSAAAYNRNNGSSRRNLSFSQPRKNELRTYPPRLLLSDVLLDPIPVRSAVGVAVPLHGSVNIEEFLAL